MEKWIIELINKANKEGLRGNIIVGVIPPETASEEYSLITAPCPIPETASELAFRIDKI